MRPTAARFLGTGLGSRNWKRNLPRGIAKISLDGEASLKARRVEIAQLRMERHRRSVLKAKGAGDARRTEHRFKMGEKAVIRYRREGILNG